MSMTFRTRSSNAPISVWIASCFLNAASTDSKSNPNWSLMTSFCESFSHFSLIVAFLLNLAASCSRFSCLTSSSLSASSRSCSAFSSSVQARFMSLISLPSRGKYGRWFWALILDWIIKRSTSKSPLSLNLAVFSFIRYWLKAVSCCWTPWSELANWRSLSCSIVALIHSSKSLVSVSYSFISLSIWIAPFMTLAMRLPCTWSSFILEK